MRLSLSIVKRLILLLLILLNCLMATAAAPDNSSSIRTDKNLFYRIPKQPEIIDNYLYSIFFSNDKKIYNLKGFDIVKAPMKVSSFKVNPAGHSVAAIISNGKQTYVEVYDLNSQNHRLAQLTEYSNPSAIAYSSDSRLLGVADGMTLNLLDSRKMIPQAEVELSFVPEMLATSPATPFIASAAGNNIEIISTENPRVVQRFSTPMPVVAMAFDPLGEKFGAISKEGRMYVYDGHTFELLHDRQIPANATSLSFHRDGKYVAVANNDSKITFVNLIELSDTTSISDPDGSLREARFIRDGKNADFIAYTSPTALKYKRISGFTPNYTRMLEEELNARMAAWSKMQPFETEEEYAARVNEETKTRQKQLFANEIATSLAGDLMSHADVTLGSYNPESGLLALSIAGMPNVYLPVPKEEAAFFGDGSNLEFRNVVYGLTPDDKFELIFAEVYNPTTGKSYIFDNLDRQSLDFLATDDAFISLELLRQTSLEDARLQDIKDDIVAKAKERSIITDHTHIAVSADVVSDYNEAGQRINNYKVDFEYTVDPDFSVHEDFPAGKYRIADSPAASSMLQIVAKAFETDFAQYVKPGSRLVINLTGTADALPIKSVIDYDGQFGDFDNEPCRIDGDLTSVSVNSADGIRNNNQLAFVRAQAVRDNLEKGVPALSDMKVSYNTSIGVSKEKGSSHRRIKVSFLFIDAF